jgi:hypothetical protein
MSRHRFARRLALFVSTILLALSSMWGTITPAAAATGSCTPYGYIQRSTWGWHFQSSASCSSAPNMTLTMMILANEGTGYHTVVNIPWHVRGTMTGTYTSPVYYDTMAGHWVGYIFLTRVCWDASSVSRTCRDYYA